MGWIRRAIGAFVIAAVVLPVMSATASACPGDCDGDGVVMVNEIIVSVRILLGEEFLEACRAGDVDGNGQIAINEVVRAVRSNLDGCPVVCGDGIVAGSEECDSGDPDTICWSDCTRCCQGAECEAAPCCLGELVDGLLPLDPTCRECAADGEGCFQAALSGFPCCSGLSCWDLHLVEGRAGAGTCCPEPGSPCITSDDCCPANIEAGWPSDADACVDGTCCVPTGSVCRAAGLHDGPCCNPTDRCIGWTPIHEWNTCCTPGDDGRCCAGSGAVCAYQGESVANCCNPTDLCAGEPASDVATLTCCAPSGEPCTDSANCCTGTCTGKPANCQ